MTPDREAGDALLRRQLASVHLLLSSERAVAEHDIVLATTFEALVSGDRTTHELRDHIRRVWPGATVALATVEAALSAAEAGGFVHRSTQLGGREAWALAHGRDEVAASEGWAVDVVERCRRELRDEANAVLGPVRDQDLSLWLDLLLRTLADGVQHSFDVLDSQVTVVGRSMLVPDSFDLDRMLARVDRSVRNAGVRAFLKGMVVNAIDRAHAFGVEVVHNLCVGYVLLAFLQRRDTASAVAAVGPVSGELALLDTPVLLRLLGTPARTQPALEVLALAVEHGFVVAMQPETIEELEHLLDSRERHVVPLVERRIREGIDEDALRSLIGDDVIGPWLDARAQGQLKAWADFRRSATALVATLRSIGCRVLEPTATDDRTLRPQFADALERVLESRGGRERRDDVLLHDGALLERVLRTRRDNPTTDDKIWPGAVVVTSDRSLQAAYEAVVDDSSPWPVAITFSQFMGVVTGFAGSVAAEKVAQVASEQISHDTLFSLTSRFPLDVVMSLAENVTSTDPISLAEARMLQLDLVEELKAHPGVLESGTEDRTRLVSEVLDRRNKRLAGALRAQRRFSEEDRRRSATAAEVAAARAEEAERQRDRTIERLTLAESANVSLGEAIKQAGHRAQRVAVVVAIVAVLFTLCAVATVAGHTQAAIGLALSGIAGGYAGYEWAESDRTVWLLPAAMTPNLLGVLDLLT